VFEEHSNWTAQDPTWKTSQVVASPENKTTKFWMAEQKGRRPRSSRQDRAGSAAALFVPVHSGRQRCYHWKTRSPPVGRKQNIKLI